VITVVGFWPEYRQFGADVDPWSSYQNEYLYEPGSQVLRAMNGDPIYTLERPLTPGENRFMRTNHGTHLAARGGRPVVLTV
jgi:hypothetical protein